MNDEDIYEKCKKIAEDDLSMQILRGIHFNKSDLELIEIKLMKEIERYKFKNSD